MALDDILRNEIQVNTRLDKQSFLVKMSVALTTIMFFGGLINSILSLITFHNKELRKVGCGIYLLASSITSLLTISMFTIKFWFLILTQITVPANLSVLRGGCAVIGSILKLFLYMDAWLNACVAIERTVNVSKGVAFDKKTSKRVARCVIVILPIFIMGTLIHEPLCHDLFTYPTHKYSSRYNESETNVSLQHEQKEHEENTTPLMQYKNESNETTGYETEYHTLCVIRYSSALQNYDTAILFFHLIAPFVANLFSAFHIVFGTARRRSATQKRQTYKEHVLEQFGEHRQLVISPIVLLLLALPRLIISLVSGCVDASKNPWLYLCGYLISFIPSMLIFVVFVLPSELYRKTFKDSMTRWRRRIHQ